MIFRLAALALTVALTSASCATAPAASTPADASKAEAGRWRPTAFESWSGRNGTGAFFAPVGPAGGSGVRSTWP